MNRRPYRANASPEEEARDPDTSPERLKRLAGYGTFPICEAIVGNPALVLMDLAEPREAFDLGVKIGGGLYTACSATPPYLEDPFPRAMRLYGRAPRSVQMGMADSLCFMAEHRGTKTLREMDLNAPFDADIAIWRWMARDMGELSSPDAQLLSKATLKLATNLSKGRGFEDTVVIYATFGQQLEAKGENEGHVATMLGRIWVHIAESLRQRRVNRPFDDVHYVLRRLWRVSGKEPDPSMLVPYLELWLGLDAQIKKVRKRYGC